MRIRQLSAVVLIAALVSTLAACKSNVGVAARVNGHKISEADVHRYLDPNGPTAAAIAQAAQNGQTLNPRNTITSVLVDEAVFRATLVKRGVDVSPAAISSLHDAAAQFLFQTSLAGAQLDAAISKNLVDSGVKASLLPHVMASFELQYILISEVKAQSQQDLANEIKNAGVRVSVNPRYGTWDAATGQMGGATVPNFLDRQPDYVVPSAPQSSSSPNS